MTEQEQGDFIYQIIEHLNVGYGKKLQGKGLPAEYIEAMMSTMNKFMPKSWGGEYND